MYGVEHVKVSEASLRTYNLSSTMIPNISSVMDDDEHFCKYILYKEIQDSRVRMWDVAILVPNLLFLLFLAVRFNRTRLKLRATSSPIYLAFYGLVICNVVISVIRCVVSMSVNAAATVGGKADKVLWVTVRFFLLATEMSVVIFGLAFGHLDSRASIRRVLLATSFIALAFTITQGTLELVLPDDTFHIPSRDFYVFGHGGMMFWFCSSLVFTMIYLSILILPWTRLRDRLTLPTRKSFYIYAGTLATLDLVQSIGAGFLNYTQNPVGLCIVDFTAAVYLTLFTPLVYHTFLSEVFGASQPSIMFSYKAQVDDAMDEDTVSLPHQQSFSSLRTDSDYIYQVHTPSIHMPLYDSQASKSSTSKERTFLYSLSSRKEKKSSVRVFDPQVSLYKSPADAGANFGNYNLTKSENYVDSQRTAPDSKFFQSAWRTQSGTHFRYGKSGNLPAGIFKSKAENFAYKLNFEDDGSNLYPRTRESTLESTENISAALDTQLVRNPADKFKFEFSDIPPLRTALDSVLRKGTQNYMSENPLPFNKESPEKHTPSRDFQSPRKKESSTSSSPIQIEASHAPQGKLLSSADLPSSSQTLLAEASPTIEKPGTLWRDDAEESESRGLSDYLISLNVSNPKTNKRGQPNRTDPSSPSYSSS